MNGSNMTFTIETSINQYLIILTALEVPDVNPDDYYVRF